MTDLNALFQMINPDNNPLFLSVPLDKCYSFEKEAVKLEGVVFEGGKITFPAKYISDVSAIKVSVNGINGDVSFEDWRTDTVKRSKIDKGAQRSMDSITATFTSATAKKYDYKKGDVVTVELVIKENADPCIVKFKNQPWEKGFFKSPIDSFVETN